MSLGVDKTPVWLELRGSETASFTLNVMSEGDGVIGADIEDYAFNFEGRPLFFTRGSQKWSASKWLRFSPGLMKVKGRKVTQFVIAVKIPKGSYPGTHNAAVFFTEKAAKRGGFRFSIRIGSRILIVVPGKARSRFGIQRCGVRRFGNGSISLWATLQNSGNCHICPSGSVTLRGPKNSEGPMTAVEPLLLPEETRIFSHRFPKLKPGNYQAVIGFEFSRKRVEKRIYFEVLQEKRLSQAALIYLVCLGSLANFLEAFARRKSRR